MDITVVNHDITALKNLSRERHHSRLLDHGHKFLAAATDGDRHVVFPAKKNDHARVLVGHAADGYTNARLAWLGAGGDSLASNSKTDPAILQWDLGSGKVIHRRERAHETNVRDLSSLAADGKLASCSFDKSAKIWSLKAPGAG